MTFAPIYLVLFALWPLLAVLGGQGFSSFILVGGVLAIPFWRPKNQRITYIGLSLALFLGWAMVTSMWSPYDPPLISGSFAEQNTAIKSGALRLSLLAFLGVILLNAMQKPLATPKRWWAVFIFVVFSLHGLVTVGGGLQFLNHYSSLKVLEEIKVASEGLQNYTRSLNSFALVLPVLIALAFVMRRVILGLLVLVLAVAAFVTAFKFGAMAAILGIMAGGIATMLALKFPKPMLYLTFFAVAGCTLFMPVIISALSLLPSELVQNLPASAQARIYNWTYTSDMIWSQPLFGYGLDATRTWTETYSEYPELAVHLPDFWAEYIVVAGHPHNMPLHLWAEIGGVGVMLFLVCMGTIFKALRDNWAENPYVSSSIIGVICAYMPIYLTSYGMWNDAVWAGIFLVIVAIFISRNVTTSKDSA